MSNANVNMIENPEQFFNFQEAPTSDGTEFQFITTNLLFHGMN
jgi:hypothetical protein